MRRYLVTVLSVALARTAIAQWSLDFGRDAPIADEELQGRIETKLKAALKGWEFERRPMGGPGVLVTGKREAERLDISTHYMASVADAMKRLRSYQRTISVGAGNEIKGVGQEALYMVYGSQVFLRFRQGRIVVEVRAAPERRTGPFDDGLWKPRERVVLEAATLIENQIRSLG
jgi:hypothetical protein